MKFLKKLSRTVLGGPKLAKGKEGARAYAVGDIHGRLDLLDQLLELLEADIASRPQRRNFIVFLGDLIDRGPDSAGVIERLRNWKPPGVRTVFLAGNHEEVLLRILDGDKGILPSWLKFGGAECARSYGLDPQELATIAEEDAIAQVQAAVPPPDREFLAGFGDTFRFGDYLFVHAGLRPGVGIEEQDRFDLRWIREPFLSDGREHGCVVVHGHTIVDQVEERPNRVAIDTGAYRTGVLTAVGIEEGERWFLSTAAQEGDSATAAPRATTA
jgi:serine/threonine protein phosphatase 1